MQMIFIIWIQNTTYSHKVTTLLLPCSKIFLCKLIASKFGLVFGFNYVGGLLIQFREYVKKIFP